MGSATSPGPLRCASGARAPGWVLGLQPAPPAFLGAVLSVGSTFLSSPSPSCLQPSAWSLRPWVRAERRGATTLVPPTLLKTLSVSGVWCVHDVCACVVCVVSGVHVRAPCAVYISCTRICMCVHVCHECARVSCMCVFGGGEGDSATGGFELPPGQGHLWGGGGSRPSRAPDSESSQKSETTVFLLAVCPH